MSKQQALNTANLIADLAYEDEHGTWDGDATDLLPAPVVGKHQVTVDWADIIEHLENEQ